MTERTQQRGVETYEPGPHLVRTLEHPLRPPEGDYKWVYLWHWPIRAMHWAAAVSLVVLVLTGFYIGRPYFLPRVELTAPFATGWVRLVHFIAAGVLVATGIIRIYWLFAGNRFERWHALFPVRGRDWVHMYKQVMYYLMIHPERAPHYLGHNPLQQLFYTMTYVVTAVMVLTGFAMYGQANPGGMIDTLFGWVVSVFGSLQLVRVVHHVLTWYFLIFIPIHLYLALRADLLERSGTISSIVSGGRFVDATETYVDD
jgi:Ni/Fe-hydrogenase b-type cytochrome subunit